MNMTLAKKKMLARHHGEEDAKAGKGCLPIRNYLVVHMVNSEDNDGNVVQIMQEYIRGHKSISHSLTCPRCGEEKLDPVMERNALSRNSDEYVCSDCGTAEALEVALNNITAFPTK